MGAVYDSCWLLVDLACVQAWLGCQWPSERSVCEFRHSWGVLFSRWLLPTGREGSSSAQRVLLWGHLGHRGTPPPGKGEGQVHSHVWASGTGESWG